MNADETPDLHAGRADAFPCADETRAIIGCAFEVLNELGHGLHEKVYENALCAEFRIRGIAHEQQRRFAVLYKSQPVGEFVPDWVVSGRVVVDTKTIDRLTEHERAKMLNYLPVTHLPVGLFLNCRCSRPEFERVVLSTADKRR
jgi:GxxExxY protein